MRRTIPLPPNVDASTANASWRDGVLTVELRKTRSGRLTVK
jgi:HSP20 family molecular chaperone IbpA